MSGRPREEPVVIRRRPGVTAWLDEKRDLVDAWQQWGLEVVIIGPLAMALAAADPPDDGESSLWLDYFVSTWGDGPIGDQLERFAQMPYLGIYGVAKIGTQWRTPQSHRWAQLYATVREQTRGMTDEQLRAAIVELTSKWVANDPFSRTARREPKVPITHWLGTDVINADQQQAEGEASGAAGGSAARQVGHHNGTALAAVRRS